MTSAAPVRRINSVDLIVEAGGATDAGRQRKRNEDQFLIARLETGFTVEASSVPVDSLGVQKKPLGTLLVVSDGMGGRAAGDVASALAVSTVRRALDSVMRYRSDDKGRLQKLEEGFRKAFDRADAALNEVADKRPDGIRLGATLTALYVEEGRGYLAHVGDSRCYLAREGQLHQLTADDTIAAELARAGVISKDQADRHRGRFVLTHSIGSEGPRDLRVAVVELEAGDRLLLTTDGCHGSVPHDAIAGAIGEGSAADVAKRLVALANEAGGADNVTALCAVIREKTG